LVGLVGVLLVCGLVWCVMVGFLWGFVGVLCVNGRAQFVNREWFGLVWVGWVGWCVVMCEIILDSKGIIKYNVFCSLIIR